MQKKSIFVIFAAVISSLGSMPYAYRFGVHLFNADDYLGFIIGSLLAIVAALANASLGIYSLYKVSFQSPLNRLMTLIILSSLSAVPTSFMSFFGYVGLIPIYVNLFIAMMVLITNTAINFTAITNFLSSMKGFHLTPFREQFVRSFGLLIGFFISTLAYVVSTSGLIALLLLVMNDKSKAETLSYLLGIVTWIPYAALFGYSVQATAVKALDYISYPSYRLPLHTKDVFIFLITLGAGASFAEVAIEFFNPHNDIPAFFKSSVMQLLIYNMLVPLAFISSMAVSMLSLQKLLKIKSRQTH